MVVRFWMDGLVEASSSVRTVPPLQEGQYRCKLKKWRKKQTCNLWRQSEEELLEPF